MRIAANAVGTDIGAGRSLAAPLPVVIDRGRVGRPKEARARPTAVPDLNTRARLRNDKGVAGRLGTMARRRKRLYRPMPQAKVRNRATLSTI
jgi:hypothetical protein